MHVTIFSTGREIPPGFEFYAFTQVPRSYALLRPTRSCQLSLSGGGGLCPLLDILRILFYM